MSNTSLIILLWLVVVIMLVITVRDAAAAVAIIALVANYMIIYRHLHMAENEGLIDGKPEEVICTVGADCAGYTPRSTGYDQNTGEEIKPVAMREGIDPVGREMYGKAQVDYNQFAETYRLGKKATYHRIGAEPVGDFNTRADAYQQARAGRAKEAIDGYISKTADYYRHHFGPELDESEARNWISEYE